MSDSSKSVDTNCVNESESRAASSLLHACVYDARGRSGMIVSLEDVSSEVFVWVQIGNLPKMRLPFHLLALQPDGSYRLPFYFDNSSEADGKEQVEQVVFPVHQEEIHVAKRRIETGSKVFLHKTVSEHTQIIDESLIQENLEIERVPFGNIVAESDLPRMRYEGDTLIVPVLEEVLIFQKQTRLKEEVRITRRRHEEHAPQAVVLRSEQTSRR
jgi:uncharacterized protein (TIGR02271 family)